MLQKGCHLSTVTWKCKNTVARPQQHRRLWHGLRVAQCVHWVWIFAERCHATQDSFHFFPQESSPRKSSSTYYGQVEGFPPGSITELCQAEDCKVKGHSINPRSKQTREDCKVKSHSINPRSKQTRVLGVCGTRSVRDMQGSGGEGAMVTRAPHNVRAAQRCQGTTAPLNIAPCFVPMPRVLASKTSHCKVNQFYSSRIIATTAPTLLPVPSTSRAEHLLFKMTPQSRVSSHSQYNSTNPRKLPCEQKKKSAAVKTPARRRGGAKCTAVKGKRKNNLNYNHSACSTHAPNSRTSTRVVYVKRYPSIKSPYNKKAALDEKTDVYANLLVLNASPHWLRSSGIEFVCTPMVRKTWGVSVAAWYLGFFPPFFSACKLSSQWIEKASIRYQALSCDPVSWYGNRLWCPCQSVLHLLGIQQILPECVAVAGPKMSVPDIRPSASWYNSAG